MRSHSWQNKFDLIESKIAIICNALLHCGLEGMDGFLGGVKYRAHYGAIIKALSVSRFEH